MGMGGGRGMGMAQGSISSPPAQQKPATREDADTLREEARILEKQLEDIKHRIDQAGKSKRVAQVDSQQCSGCGTCVDSCPVGAITLNGVASIDVNRCIGCGECVDRCPLEAITIT
jgi:ferredoxin